MENEDEEAMARGSRHSRRDRAGLHRTLALALLIGCYSPTSYAPARTVEPGHASSGGGLEGHGGGDTVVAPSVFFAMRQGMSERVDMGLRVVPDLRGDARLNFLRTDIVDMTIAPTLWFGWLRWLATIANEAVPPAGAELVLQTDLRFGARASLVTQLGGGYAVMPPHIPELFEEGTDDPHHGALVHAGVGFHLRLSRSLVVHPHGSAVMMNLGWEDPALKLVVGLAFWSER